MSEGKKIEKTVEVVQTPAIQAPLPTQSPNTIDPLANLPEEDRRKIEAVRSFYLEEAQGNQMYSYESFGKSRAERDKVWKRWAEIAKDDSRLIFKGIIPEEKKEEKKKEPLDFSKIEDENVRREIIKQWLGKYVKKPKETQAEVV